MTPETENALLSTAKRCSEEIKAAMSQTPKPKFDAVSTPVLRKHYDTIKALNIPFIKFMWTVGVINGRFGKSNA